MRDSRDSQRKRPTHAASHAAAHGTSRFGSHAAGAPRTSSHRAAAPSRRARSVEVSDEEGISTIRAGQGARVTTRDNAAQAASRARRNAEERYFERHPEARGTAAGPERSRKNVVLLVVLAMLALAIVFLLGRCVTIALSPSPDEGAAEQPLGEQGLTSDGSQQAPAEDPESEVAATDGSVSYQGSTYALATQDDGLEGVVRTDADGSATTLFMVEGTPAALARWGNTIVVPENRDGSWDVVCFVIDGHTGSASYVAGQDGSMVTGSGEISSVSLDGSTLHVTTSDGATTDVELS